MNLRHISIGLVAVVAWLAGGLPGRAEQIVISEIMYHPRGELPEFVELYNNTSNPFDIAGWKLSGQIEYTFPTFSAADPRLTLLRPFERIVVSQSDDKTIRAAYKIPNTVRVYGPWAGRLGKTGDRIRLRDKNGLIVCQVRYSDREKWSPAANGAGHSLVLISPDKSVDDWRNWTVSSRPGGTPGTDPTRELEIPVASPEVISREGVVLIDYGDPWRYFARPGAPDPKWRDAKFDDRAWPVGAGMFGFCATPLPAPGIRTPRPAGVWTIYLRKEFVFNGANTGLKLTLDNIVDDGAVYYLNGQEIGRVGMPGGNVVYNTPAARNIGEPKEEQNVLPGINAGLIVKGTNVLAVEVHQVALNSPDLVFGARLKGAGPALGPAQGQTEAVFNEIRPGTAGKGFIEFYNTGVQPISLKDHYLSNYRSNLTRFKFTGNMVIRARGFVAVDYETTKLPLAATEFFLTAPDGKTVLSALRHSAPIGDKSLARKPDGANSWFLMTDPTKDAPNVSGTGLISTVRLNEVEFAGSLFNKQKHLEWVELFNAGYTPQSLAGYFLASQRDFSDKVSLRDVTLPARGVKAFSVPFPVVQDEVVVYLVDGENSVKDAWVFHPPKHGNHLQAFPDGSREWYATVKDTKDKPNNPERNTDIVINEIMFAPPYTQKKSEFIELHNRGRSAVSLAGWHFTDGTEFTFPKGSKIPAGGYLVVAGDESFLRGMHGNINVIGNFEGKLSNQGDLVRLVDQHGNLVSQVDYRFGGDWPFISHNGGSSLELRHPLMDNSLSSAWADSDESSKSKFKTYSFTGVYDEWLKDGQPTDYQELHLYLISKGHVVLKNIEFRLNGAGTNYIANPTVMATDGKSSSGWVCQGTHWASYMTNGELHLISDGRGDNRANRSEIDIVGIAKGQKYELRFDARWISGTPRLIAHTWDYSINPSFLLAVPPNVGTPGRANSRLQAAPPPQVEQLSHRPAVPKPTDTVKITAHVPASVRVASVQLFYRADSNTDQTPWLSKPMVDDGKNGGDMIAGDAIYTAEITDLRSQGQIVQFYVLARGPGGQVTMLPRSGPEKPALYIVDNQPVPRDLALKRFVVSAYDMEKIAGGHTNKYGFKFPRLSNHYHNTTFIANETDIYYNAEIHNSGSGYTRQTDMSRGKWKLPGDRLYRSHTKFTYDNDPDGGARLHNRVVRFWMYQLGHPVAQAEFIRVVVNNTAPLLREETEPVANDFLNRVYKDGSKGELYRPEMTWWLRDDWGGGSPLQPDWVYKGEDAGRYRAIWMKRTSEVEDDFGELISLTKTLTDNRYSQAEIEKRIDPYNTLRHAVVRGYSGDWDTFTVGNAHNALFYRRPGDGLWQFFQWDSDQGFSPANIASAFYGDRVRSWLEKPYNKRLFNYYLAELVENYTKDSPRFFSYLKAEEEASTAVAIDATQYRQWCVGRDAAAQRLLGPNYKLAFKITTNAGKPITTPGDTITLEGTAPYGIFAISVAGQPFAKPEWKTEVTWVLPNLGLAEGANEIHVKGLDQWGKVLQEDKLVVTKAPAAPVVVPPPAAAN